MLCGDVAPFTEHAAPPTRLPGFERAYGDTVLEDVCDAWPVSATDPAAAEPVSSEVPVLVLVGRLAPTPAELVRKGTTGLVNASVVEVPTGSHNVIGSDCLLDLRNRWLEDPRPLAEPPDCLDARLEWK